MPRTTLDIDATVLSELKRLQKTERRPLGALASELLADALARTKPAESAGEFTLPAAKRSMDPLVDLEDKAAVQELLDREQLR